MAVAPSVMKANRNRFFDALKSATAPSTGLTSAASRAASDVVKPQYAVAWLGASVAAATVAK